MITPQVSEFIYLWQFTRAETLELLKSLDNQKLQFLPEEEKWQPLYYQFACMARTQIVYTKAIETGVMDFSMFKSGELPDKFQNQTQEELKNFLNQANDGWLKALEEKGEWREFKIKWPGFEQSLPAHISSLAEHERLHNGQIISYFTLAGFELPEGFKTNWAL